MRRAHARADTTTKRNRIMVLGDQDQRHPGAVNELLSLATQYATSKEATGPLPMLGDKETVPDSSKAMPSNIAIQGTMKDVKGGKKRWKQGPQSVTTAAGRDNDNDSKQADSSDIERIMTTGCSVKRHARPPTNHFKRVLEEAYPYHAYPIKHKHRDCGMMKNFMISRSLTRTWNPRKMPS
jgi:hypothetical protein